MPLLTASGITNNEEGSAVDISSLSPASSGAYSPASGRTAADAQAAAVPGTGTNVASVADSNASSDDSVSLSPQGLELAASTSRSTVVLPDLKGIAAIEKALSGVPDINPTTARANAQLEREKKKKKSTFSMFDIDPMLKLRDKIRAALQGRRETPLIKQQQDEAKFKKGIEDGKPLSGRPSDL